MEGSRRWFNGFYVEKINCENRSERSRENRAIAINPDMNEGLGRIFL